MVAPSFQTYKFIVEEPFLKNGKLYVTVEHPNTHNHRDVRWYTDAEYKKAYGNKSQKDRGNAGPIGKSGFDGLKKARGFSEGPVAVVRGAVAANESWLKYSSARYAVDIGWYFVSTEPLPQEVPTSLFFVFLDWEEAKDGDDMHIKPSMALRDILNDKIKHNKDIVRFPVKTVNAVSNS